MAHLVHHLQNSDMTNEEHLLKCFTCQQLKCLRNWPDCDNAFDAQLNAHGKAGCIGVPVLWPIVNNGHAPNVLEIHWTQNQVPALMVQGLWLLGCDNLFRHMHPVSSSCVCASSLLWQHSTLSLSLWLTQVIPSNNHHHQLSNAVCRLTMNIGLGPRNAIIWT